MDNKSVLVIGAARSGISTVEVLKTLGAKVTLNDIKTKEQLGDLYNALVSKTDTLLLGCHPSSLAQYDLIVLSPGVPTDLPFILEAKTLGIEVIGELELAYRYCKGSFLGITGTNGKTTTTSLVGEIFKASGRDYAVVGNIGLPAISKALAASEATVMVTELSSFQLESVVDFHPKVATVLNLSPDHLNRHKTMAAYTDAKSQIFARQTSEDILLLNYDNQPTRQLAKRAPSRVVFFSRKKILEEGIFVEKHQIIIADKGRRIPVGLVEDIFIPGSHNVENVLAAVGLTYFSGIEVSDIMSAVKAFKGVAHRVEFVETVQGITFYNDSKGTNPDASIQAVKAMNKPTVLIAGGMDKGADFNTFVEAFGVEIKHIILIGETKDLIAETAQSHGFTAITKVDSMTEAVDCAFDLAEFGDNVLLSPACASWDMYESYEMRGDEFKHLVRTHRQ